MRHKAQEAIFSEFSFFREVGGWEVEREKEGEREEETGRESEKREKEEKTGRKNPIG